ncbi:ArsR/SmtB family transcription factor [Parasphingorhabdus sp.]|uniref:ArsR/SmtB family transcription factor n=1 Tax=Parasphingorhabdus sp. TaxID=2709688 RepID=UPI003003A26A
MTAIFESRDRAEMASEKLKVYAQPQRLMILSFLLTGEASVSEIDAATGIGQPALSQQLAALRRADIVKTRREGKQVCYDLADETARLCVRTMEALLTDQPDPQSVSRAAGTQARPDTTPSTGTAGFARIL